MSVPQYLESPNMYLPIDPYDLYQGVEDIDSEASGMMTDPCGPLDAILFVSNISTETTEKTLRRFFKLYGLDVVKASVLREKSERQLPYAFVQFMDSGLAMIAIMATRGKMLDGSMISVQKAKVNRTLFIAKMEKNINSGELRDIMERYGRVDHVTIIKNHQTNKSKGCGFVKMLSREDAINAHKGLRTERQRWVVEWATSNNDPETLGIDRSNIFVGGLDPNTATKESIQGRFSAYGTIESISLVNKEVEPSEEGDQTRSAFAFVRYNDAKSSGMAIEQQNGSLWDDRRIRVQYCESREMKDKRRANKFYSMQQYGPYYGHPMSYPMGYPMPPVVYPPPWTVYNALQEPGPTPQEASEAQNSAVNGKPKNGQVRPQEETKNEGKPWSKMNVNTTPYQPQYHKHHTHQPYTSYAPQGQLDEESKALVNSLTALSLDRAPRW